MSADIAVVATAGLWGFYFGGVFGAAVAVSCVTAIMMVVMWFHAR